MTTAAFTAGRVYEACASGTSRREAARKFKMSRTTINAIMNQPTLYDGSISRKRKVNDEVAKRRKALRRLALQNRYKRLDGERIAIERKYPTAQSLVDALAKQYPSLTTYTVNRDLLASGLALRVRPKVVANTPTLNAQRLAFAKRVLRARNFNQIKFSDEVWVNDNDHAHRKEWVDLADMLETRPTPRVYQKRPKIKLMFWGAIGWNYKSKLIILRDKVSSEVYVAQVLEVAKEDLETGVFMQDNAKPHTARNTMDWLNNNSIRVLLGWPPHSPHLNPIEHLWALLHQEISRRRPKSLDELERVAHEVWDSITLEVINCYIAGFKTSLKKCVEREGEPW